MGFENDAPKTVEKPLYIKGFDDLLQIIKLHRMAGAMPK
jgi:hypothetical protein